MNEESYLIIGKSGIKGVRKSKPKLNWDEIACRISLDIPDVLFERPQLEATLKVDEEKIQAEKIFPDLIINTKELIEQQTGAKIDFKVIEYVREGESESEEEGQNE